MQFSYGSLCSNAFDIIAKSKNSQIIANKQRQKRQSKNGTITHTATTYNMTCRGISNLCIT